MASGGRINSELLEDRERWLSIFSECYTDNVSIKDLEELKSPFVLSIYLQFLKITLNASLDNMKMIGLNSPEHMQRYPEAYEKAILMPRVAKTLAWFFNLYAGEESFTFGDLMNPRPDRTRHFFNIITNFVIEYGDTKEKLDSIRQEVEEEKDRLESGKEKRQAKLKTVTQQIAECQIQEEEMVKLTKTLSVDVEQKQTLKARLREQLDNVKQEVADVTSMKQAAELAYIELEEHRVQLQQVVVSQDELQELRQREAELKESDLELNAKKKQLNDMETIMAENERILALFTNHIHPVVDYIGQQLQEIENVSCLKSISDRSNTAHSACDEADHQLSVLQQRLATMNETRRAASLAWSKKKQGIEVDMRAARDMIEQLRSADEGREAAERGLDKELQDTECLLADLMEQEKEVTAFWDHLFGQLTAAMEQHNLETHADLQALMQKLKYRPS